MIRLLFILSIVGTTLSSCQEKYFFDQTVEIDPSGWQESVHHDFSFDISDITQLYNLFLDINHSTEYNYQNLYVKIDTKYPDAHIISDTLSIDFAKKSGFWNGDCSGEQCDLRVFLAHKILFEQKGAYSISFSQFARDPYVKEINSLSLRLQEIEEK